MSFDSKRRRRMSQKAPIVDRQRTRAVLASRCIAEELQHLADVDRENDALRGIILEVTGKDADSLLDRLEGAAEREPCD